MMSEPKLSLYNEISLGLAPLVIKDIYERLRQINDKRITIILVEQDIKRRLKAANHAYILLEGKFPLQRRLSVVIWAWELCLNCCSIQLTHSNHR